MTKHTASAGLVCLLIALLAAPASAQEFNNVSCGQQPAPGADPNADNDDDGLVDHCDEDDDNVQRNKYGEVTGGPKVVKHLFEEIAPVYADRNGGYTRIIRLGKHRIGDASDLCVLQLVREEDTGPQLAGNRARRAKANKRMEFAAKLAKGNKKEAKPEAEAAPAEDAGDEAKSDE